MATQQYITLFVRGADEGQMGIRIDIETDGPAPRVCPGLGGWKRGDLAGDWWTRVKGQIAGDLIRDMAGSGLDAFALRCDLGGRILARAQSQGDGPEELRRKDARDELKWRDVRP
jgi:hypothetical protein